MAVSSDALNDLRATLDLLRDADDAAPTTPTLDLASLTQLLDRAKAAGLDVDANVQLNGHAVPIAVGQAGFRIVQEALTNVMRHAAASRARVNLYVETDTLHVEVTDDGNAAAPTVGGHGLRGMRERAAALGGDVTAGPAERGGWQIHAWLPLKPGEAMTIHVLLAEDQPIVRAGFRALLDAEADLAVVGEAADGREAVALAHELRPDLVLMDIRMPELDGLEATRQITAEPTLRENACARAYDVRARRIRLRRTPRRRERLPAQGRRARRPARRDPPRRRG